MSIQFGVANLNEGNNKFEIRKVLKIVENRGTEVQLYLHHKLKYDFTYVEFI